MNSKSMSGWIGFASGLLVIIGGLDVLQGVIALFEDDYYVPTGSGFLVFDLTGWGWTMIIWGVLLVFAGIGLGGRAGVGALVRDRRHQPELHRRARLPRQHADPALVTDCDRAEHHRALRADCTLEREPGRQTVFRVGRSPGSRPSRMHASCATASPPWHERLSGRERGDEAARLVVSPTHLRADHVQPGRRTDGVQSASNAARYTPPFPSRFSRSDGNAWRVAWGKRALRIARDAVPAAE